jgi:hypothetical protein
MWRGLRLDYSLNGPIVVTGPMADSGTGYCDLGDELAGQAEKVTNTVREMAQSHAGGVTATALLEAVQLP